MASRTGEKLGWSVGWAGGFLWVGILAAVFLVQGKAAAGLAGLGLAALAAFASLSFAPWRRPTTPYWKLMLPLYALLALSVAWAVAAFGPREADLTWWSLLWLLPLLVPFGSVGRRRWEDGDSGR